MCYLNVKQDSGLVLFSNLEFDGVRTVVRDGEPWFFASDVAQVLGYADPSEAVNQHCKKALKTAFIANPADDSTPPVEINIIPESDLYRLVLRSNVPNVEEFQTWVCEEVLPSFRKTGFSSLGWVAVPNVPNTAEAAPVQGPTSTSSECVPCTR